MRREYTPEFERAWSLYPSRGDSENPKWPAFKAWRARLREGATSETLTLATEAYAAHCRRKGSLGTNFVLMGSTFYGPNLRFEHYLAKPEPAPVSRKPVRPKPPEELVDARPFLRELIASLGSSRAMRGL